MSKLPAALIDTLEGVAGFNREAFIAVHESREQVTSIRINPAKWSIQEAAHYSPLIIHSAVPWSQYGLYLDKRPSFTFDPLFHAGCYYVQDASSMFLEQALQQAKDLSQPLRVLDLCAAPGGKTTHIQSLLSKDSLLVSNEVIRSRANILTQNIIKWGSDNVLITNNDPQHFAKLPGYFDIIVADAPCSGSGLFRRDEEAIDEWSEANVQLCCGRQKRILADVLPSLKEDGLLVYSTCSYSREEDEEIIQWLEEEMGMENVKCKMKNEWGIVITETLKGAEGYRFYPYNLKGEGFFLSCFRKRTSDHAAKRKTGKPEFVTRKETDIIQPWLAGNGYALLRFREDVIALPHHFADDYVLLQAALNLIYAGVGVGQVMKEKLVPHHALALSTILSPEKKATGLSYEQAIKYLQRADLNIETVETGWQPVSFHNHNLGWINSLKNRVNNYYPKEFRILKQSNDAASKN